jgi:hypothetical protein
MTVFSALIGHVNTWGFTYISARNEKHSVRRLTSVETSLYSTLIYICYAKAETKSSLAGPLTEPSIADPSGS